MPTFLVHDRLTGTLVGVPEPSSRIAQTIAFVNSACSPELVLIRILLGTVAITHVPSGNSWDQAIDYSVLGMPPSSVNTRMELLATLQGRNIEPDILDRHLRLNLRQSDYYQDLCGEILHTFLRIQSAEHTLAFLHIYRFLERISYAFPLLYAARTRDFRNTFALLKTLLDGGEKSELGFFRKFVCTSVDSDLRDGQSKIDLGAVESSDRSSAFAVLRRFIEDDDIKSSVQDQEVEIKNEVLLNLMVELRNRYFHFTSGHAKNITTIELPDSDAFFSCVNALFLNWLTAIYFEILAHNLEAA